MPYIDVNDGSVHYLNHPTVPLVPETFDIIFSQYRRHPEAKSLAPDGCPCGADSAGLLKRFCITASEFHLIGKETERSWQQNDDISTVVPMIITYPDDKNSSTPNLRQVLQQISLETLERETGLSRHTILRVRRAQPVHTRSLRLLRNVVSKVRNRKRF